MDKRQTGEIIAVAGLGGLALAAYENNKKAQAAAAAAEAATSSPPAATPPALAPIVGGPMQSVWTQLLAPTGFRDANPHFVTYMLNLSNAFFWGMIVNNQLNQSVTVTLIAGDTQSPADCGSTGLTATIAANTKLPVIIQQIWLPYIGLMITPGGVPTNGNIDVSGWTQEPASGA